MYIRNIGPNQTEYAPNDNMVILYSYDTRVAALDKKTGIAYRTERHYSVTTSKHINAWIRAGRAVETKPQSWLDELS